MQLQGVLYVVGETAQNGTIVFQLHGLDVSTGQERMNGPVAITASLAMTDKAGRTPQTWYSIRCSTSNAPGCCCRTVLFRWASAPMATAASGTAGWSATARRTSRSSLVYLKLLPPAAAAPSGNPAAVRSRMTPAISTLITGNGDYDGKQRLQRKLFETLRRLSRAIGLVHSRELADACRTTTTICPRGRH